MLGHRFAVPPLLELGHGYHPIWQGTNSPIDDRKNLGMIPICSMVLVYLPTFARTKSPSFVGKYTSTMGSMEHMGSMELSYVDLSTSTTVDPHRLHPGRSSKRAWPRTKSDGFRRKTSEQSFTQFSHLIFMIDFSVCDPSIVSPYYSIKSSVDFRRILLSNIRYGFKKKNARVFVGFDGPENPYPLVI